MKKLALPDYTFKFKSSENKRYIFDCIRKKYVVLSPEEWVRQHIIQYLIQEKNYPISLIAVEKQLKINGLNKRTDILVFSPNGSPFLIVACKAATVKIDQKTFDQIARYNIPLEAKFLMVTNGLKNYICQMDKENERYTFLKSLPSLV